MSKNCQCLDQQKLIIYPRIPLNTLALVERISINYSDLIDNIEKNIELILIASKSN